MKDESKKMRTIHPVECRVSRAVFLIFLIAVLAYDLFIGRPG